MNISGVLISSTVVVLLVGCASAPTGPSVLSLPGTGKSFGDFRLDDAQCRQYAAQQTGALPSDPGVRNAVIATAVGALAGAAINGSQGAGIGAGAGLVVGSVSGAGEAVSYTHLDVYKRQGWDEMTSGRIQIVCIASALMKITSIPALLRTKLETLQ